MTSEERHSQDIPSPNLTSKAFSYLTVRVVLNSKNVDGIKYKLTPAE